MLNAAVCLRRSDESEQTLDAEESKLLPEGIGHVLIAAVVADRQAAGSVVCECPE
jgi:hypothetical protein